MLPTSSFRRRVLPHRRGRLVSRDSRGPLGELRAPSLASQRADLFTYLYFLMPVSSSSSRIFASAAMWRACDRSLPPSSASCRRRRECHHYPERRPNWGNCDRRCNRRGKCVCGRNHLAGESSSWSRQPRGRSSSRGLEHRAIDLATTVFRVLTSRSLARGIGKCARSLDSSYRVSG
jgi:hypothetical protein